MYFWQMFTQTDKDSILYKDKEIFQMYRHKLIGKHKIKFTFVSTSSNHEQCIILLLLGVKCNIYWNNKKYQQPKTRFPTLDLFEKDYGKEVILDIELLEGDLGICNGAIEKIGDKNVVTYFEGGCAMIIEKISETKIRFYCNDYENDDDFDDFIFEMEILE